MVSELQRRGCHQLLLAYYDQELVRKSLFHAISEAANSILDRIRRRAGLGNEKEELYGRVFGTRIVEPLVRINQ